MTCAAFVCTASSSASRKPTAMTLSRRACALPFSSREPTPACCIQNSLRSCPPIHPETPLFGPPLIVSRLRSIAAARRKNSSPENLTDLHFGPRAGGLGPGAGGGGVGARGRGLG